MRARIIRYRAVTAGVLVALLVSSPVVAAEESIPVPYHNIYLRDHFRDHELIFSEGDWNPWSRSAGRRVRKNLERKVDAKIAAYVSGLGKKLMEVSTHLEAISYFRIQSIQSADQELKGSIDCWRESMERLEDSIDDLHDSLSRVLSSLTPDCDVAEAVLREGPDTFFAADIYSLSRELQQAQQQTVHLIWEAPATVDVSELAGPGLLPQLHSTRLISKALKDALKEWSRSLQDSEGRTSCESRTVRMSRWLYFSKPQKE